MNHELLFWYTGWIVWFIISLLIAVTAILSFFIAAAKSWYWSRNWKRLKVFLNEIDDLEHLDIENAYRSACRKFNRTPNDSTNDTKWLFYMAKEHRRLRNLHRPSTATCAQTADAAREGSATTKGNAP